MAAPLEALGEGRQLGEHGCEAFGNHDRPGYEAAVGHRQPIRRSWSARTTWERAGGRLPSSSVNRTRRPTRSTDRFVAPGASSGLRLDVWPTDDSVAHLVVLEHDAAVSAAELETWVERARRRGFTTLRTGALFPVAARAVRDAGFSVIDTLVLLRAELDHPRRPEPVPDSSIRTRRLWGRHHAAAAALDRIAFGALWGNDTRSLADIRHATPAHRARRIGAAGDVDAFAISGAGGRTGYVQRLAVHPDHRRRGYADALLADAIEWMRSRELSTALVNTGEANVAALALYERWGFERLDERLVVAELDLGAAGR